MAHPLRDLLNTRKWRDGDLSRCVIVVVHRGAPGDVREIAGVDVSDVVAGGLLILGDDPEGEETVIPWHRVLEVRLGDRVLWGPDVGDPEV